MLRNFIFDWSGTLSDDMYQVYQGSMQVFRKYGIAEISYEQFKLDFDYPYMKFYAKFSDEVSKEAADEIFEDVLHKLDDPNPFAGGVELLQFLQSRDSKLILLSGVPRNKLIEEVKLYGYESFFSAVYGGVYDKTEVIDAVLNAQGFIPSQTAYVGDMQHDIEAGRAGKVVTVAITHGYQSSDLLRGASPDYEVASLYELRELLGRLVPDAVTSL